MRLAETPETRQHPTTGAFVFTGPHQHLLWERVAPTLRKALGDGRTREIRSSGILCYGQEYQLNLLILLTDAEQAEVGEHVRSDAVLPVGAAFEPDIGGSLKRLR